MKHAEQKSETVGAGRRFPIANEAGGRVHSGNQHTPTRQERQALTGSNGTVCAWVVDDCLCKTVAGSRHFLRKPAGIAFDAAILAQAGALGAVRAWVLDRETGTTYRVALGAFKEHGVKLERGCGPQVCLPFTFWQTTQPGADVQLSLLAAAI